jgi:hypothetical protein
MYGLPLGRFEQCKADLSSQNLVAFVFEERAANPLDRRSYGRKVNDYFVGEAVPVRGVAAVLAGNHSKRVAERTGTVAAHELLVP